MAQFGRPSADISVGAWTTAPLWEKLDEVTPDDTTTEVTTGNSPNQDTFEVRVTGITDPNDNTGHIVRVRVKKDSSGGRTIGFEFVLLQGATTIASWSAPNVSNAYTTFTHNLSEAEAGNITDYSDLRVRVVANSTGGGAVRSGQATWIEMEAPDAPAGGTFDETVEEEYRSSEVTSEGLDAVGQVDEALSLVAAGEFEIDFLADVEVLNLADVVDDSSFDTVDETVSEALTVGEVTEAQVSLDESLADSQTLAPSLVDFLTAIESEQENLSLAPVTDEEVSTTTDENISESLSLTHLSSGSLDAGESVGEGVSLLPGLEAVGEGSEEIAEQLTFSLLDETQIEAGEVQEITLTLTPAIITEIEGGEEVTSSLVFTTQSTGDSGTEETVFENLSLSGVDDEGAEAGEVIQTTLNLSDTTEEDTQVDEEISDTLSLSSFEVADEGLEETILEAITLAPSSSTSLDIGEELSVSLQLSPQVIENIQGTGEVVEETVFELFSLEVDGGLELEFNAPTEDLIYPDQLTEEAAKLYDEVVSESLVLNTARDDIVHASEVVSAILYLKSQRDITVGQSTAVIDWDPKDICPSPPPGNWADCEDDGVFPLAPCPTLNEALPPIPSIEC